MSSISDEKYVRLTTFTKDGRRKESPVWIAELGDGTVGFTTELDSWKTKRIRNTPRVELTPSNMRGRVKQGAPTATGTAVAVCEAGAAGVHAAIEAKYGWQHRLVEYLGKRKEKRGKGDNTHCGVIVTLDD